MSSQQLQDEIQALRRYVKQLERALDAAKEAAPAVAAISEEAVARVLHESGCADVEPWLFEDLLPAHRDDHLKQARAVLALLRPAP